MTNLGSDDTPVKGSEFSLPAGAKLDEDNGDLVIRDSAGNIVMRRDETAGEWDIAGIADDPHDNTQHSVDFAEDPHDNTQHSETFLANGEDFDGQGTSSLTNLTAVETDQLNTEPTGTLVTLDGNQSVADDTVTTIEWGTEDARGNVSNLLNASNEVVIPAGFKWAKITVGIDWNTKTEMDLLDTRINGAAPPVGADADIRIDSGRTFKTQTAFFSVSEGDVLSIRTRHQFGSSLDIIDTRTTFMEVLLL